MVEMFATMGDGDDVPGLANGQRGEEEGKR
jgi:hypothetical protein